MGSRRYAGEMDNSQVVTVRGFLRLVPSLACINITSLLLQILKYTNEDWFLSFVLIDREAINAANHLAYIGVRQLQKK